MQLTTEKFSFLNEKILECLGEAEESVIVEKLTSAAIKTLGADFGFAWLRQNNSDKLELVYNSPQSPYQPTAPRQTGTGRSAMKSANPLLIDDYPASEYFRPDSAPYVKSLAVIPISFKNDVYGSMFICFKDFYKFTEEDKGCCLFLGNNIAQAITINRLVKSEQESRQQAEYQQARFRAMIENSYDVIALLDRRGIITEISNSIMRMSGHKAEDLFGHYFGDFIHSEDLDAIKEQLQQALAQPNIAMTVEARYRHNDGTWRWLEVSGINKLNDPSIKGIIANIRDVTERKEAEKTIKQQASQDSLTGLFNRQEFSSRFYQALEQAKRNNGLLAVMFLDMDRFKNVNDRLGHNAGDTLLKVVASRLAASLRSEDVASRFGGDEFLVLINEVKTSKDVVAAAEKILKAVNLPVQLDEHSLYPSVSIGISIYPNDGLDLEGLKKNADIALYRAKENGRNRFSLYDHSLNGLHQAARFTLENDLREALLFNQIEVYYQPIINLKRRKLIAVEALARWNHPEKGLLQPSEFISLAEETGLIAELDRAVLKQACHQAKLWQDSGLPKFRMAVNLSAQQFSEPEFVAVIAGILAETHLQANDLELEITESLAMSNMELTSANMKELKKLGVHITIDDFGTGYSSLNYLKRFPIHGLKIDKSFVKHCITNPSDTSITKTIVAMAHTLNLKVTAEGVEQLQQLDFLKSLGCDGAQGFFIAKPMPAKLLPAWLMAKYSETELDFVKKQPQTVVVSK